MVWSYNTANLASSDLYKVRLMVGDTDSTRQQFQDEEISYALTVETSPTLAAAAVCDLLAAKYSFLVNTENGSLRVSAAARWTHYRDLADRLRKGGAGNMPGDAKVINATMYVGGSSKDAKQAIYDDNDAEVGPFRMAADDHPDNTQSITYDAGE